MNMYLWAKKWGIPDEAIGELRSIAGLKNTVSNEGATTETGVQKRERLNAPRCGGLLWRNNVGACEDVRGNHIRYGLANDSRQMNQKIKSSDLIGITPVIITPDHMGMQLGVFTAIECKHPGWVWKGDDHEQAQWAFGQLVLSHGGMFRFAN